MVVILKKKNDEWGSEEDNAVGTQVNNDYKYTGTEFIKQNYCCTCITSVKTIPTFSHPEHF